MTRCGTYLLLLFGGSAARAIAQQPIPLSDLSAFRPTNSNWKLVASVRADITKSRNLTISPGTGILVSEQNESSPAPVLITRQTFGDVKLEFDYLLAKDSQADLRLQDRYVIRLADSWGKPSPTAEDNGGIPNGTPGRPSSAGLSGLPTGGTGYAPRQNVSRAPGLWQHLLVDFQAPRFNPQGRKIANGRLLRVELNGVLLHENIELIPSESGPRNESAPGPLGFRNRQGAIAIRNLSLTPFDQVGPTLTALAYTVYKGPLPEHPDSQRLTAVSAGELPALTSRLGGLPPQHLVNYVGHLSVKEGGEYTFGLTTPGGSGQLRINNQTALDWNSTTPTARVQLPAGEVSFQLQYAKRVSWEKAPLLLTVSGSRLRETDLTEANDRLTQSTNPILVESSSNTLLRCFMDLPNQRRLVHAISVGSQQKLHFTYDPDFGAIVQVWRGNFLDATPMWSGRGDGSARPTGAILLLGNPAQSITQLTNPGASWPTDTVGTAYRFKGYRLSADGLPTFFFWLGNALFSDSIRVINDGQGIRRELAADAPREGVYCRVAAGKTIEFLTNGLYLIGDGNYYLRLDETDGAAPMLRTTPAGQELLVPFQKKVSYSLFY